MSTKQQVKEQIQEDLLSLLSLLEGMGIEKVLNSRDWESLKDEICGVVVTGIDSIED